MCVRACGVTAMPKRVKNAKIALIDFNLTKQKLSMGVSVNITDPAKLEGILKRLTYSSFCISINNRRNAITFILISFVDDSERVI